MLTLKNSMNGLRGVLMALAAVVTLSVASPKVEAAPADTVVTAWQANVQVISRQYYDGRALIYAQMQAEVRVGMLQGKSFTELQTIVDKYEKKFLKHFKSTRKAINKAEKQALKNLKAYGSPAAHVAYIMSQTQQARQYLDGESASIGAQLNLWLIHEVV